MRLMSVPRATALVISLLAAGVSQAATNTTTVTLPAYTGAGVNNKTETVGTFLFNLPAGESIVSAVLSGFWGNSGQYTTAGQLVYADGLQVASCASGDTCWAAKSSPMAWSYTFTANQFSALLDGQLTLTDKQIACCQIRLGATTLTIETAPAVPEPETYAMMLVGLAAVAWVSRRKA